MPLTPKGEEIHKAMMNTYGSKKKADEVFYASKNAGKIKGVESREQLMENFARKLVKRSR